MFQLVAELSIVSQLTNYKIYIYSIEGQVLLSTYIFVTHDLYQINIK